MKYNADDPRITAYALGELEGDEVQALEQALADDTELKAAVEDIRRTAGMLEHELSAEQTPLLTHEQRTRIESGPRGSDAAPVIFTMRRWVAPVGLAAAACLALAVIVPLQLQRGGDPAATGKGDNFAFEGGNLRNLSPSAESLDAIEEQVALLDGAVHDQTNKFGERGDTLALAKKEAAALPESLTRPGPLPKQSGEDDEARQRRGSRILSQQEVPSAPIARAAAPGEKRKAPGGPGSPSGGMASGADESGAGRFGGGGSGGGGGASRRAPTRAVAGGLGDVGEVTNGGADLDANVTGFKQVPASAPPATGLGAERFAADAPAESEDPYTDAFFPGVGPEDAPVLADQEASFINGLSSSATPDRDSVLDGFRSSDWTSTSYYALETKEQKISNRITQALQDQDAAENTVDRLVELREDLRREIVRRNEANREAYEQITDNPFLRPTESPLSTFSIDVDTAAYSNIRRFIMQQNARPPKDAVRIEEMINYFNYAYAPPSADNEHPFAVHTEVNQAPWSPGHRLVRIGLKGREIDADMRPATNLVFLLDVSGSMNDREKLPLVKQSMKKLVDRLTGDDRLAIVVYAGASGLALDSTYCDDKEKILAALDNLHAGGSTNGGAGIELAYKIAGEHFIEGGVNRVILCTDGDFNVGVSDDGSLVRLIEDKRTTGVFLSVLGFGRGNWQDAKMEKLTNAGNGNFAYIDSIREAEKVLVEDMAGTLVTIAKDVKVQVEFNPAKVGAYRLIGYENRRLAARDFNDDTKDAGEIGAGHTVTALYEIIPAGAEPPTEVALLPVVDELKYQKPVATTEVADSDDLLTVKLRYKLPDGETSTKLEHPVVDADATLSDASPDYRFSAAVASFGMILRGSPHKGDASLAAVLDMATAGKGADERRHRDEFIRMVEQTRSLVGE